MKILEEFNEKILSATRNDIIDREIGILEGKVNGVINQRLNNLMSSFSNTQKDSIKKIIIDTVDATIHEFLYNLDENNKFKIVAYDEKNFILNLSEQHEENLVGSFLDSIDNYGKYNSSYEIIMNNKPINKQ